LELPKLLSIGARKLNLVDIRPSGRMAAHLASCELFLDGEYTDHIGFSNGHYGLTIENTSASALFIKSSAGRARVLIFLASI